MVPQPKLEAVKRAIPPAEVLNPPAAGRPKRAEQSRPVAGVTVIHPVAGVTVIHLVAGRPKRAEPSHPAAGVTVIHPVARQ